MIYTIGFVLLILVLMVVYAFNHRDNPRIFLYHNVSDKEISYKTNMSSAKFERQIAMLKKLNFEFYTIEDLFDDKEIQKHNRRAFITFDDGFEDIYTNVFPILKKYNVKATVYACRSIAGKKVLSDEQMKTMQDSGLVEFGSHSTNHINMLEYSDDIVNDDIVKSKSTIESITGAPCTSFAYPYGKFTDAHVEMLEKAGYKTAVIIGKKLKSYQELESDKYRIPRIEPRGNMNIFQFIVLILFGKYKI